jgi:pyruvate formate-lyase/glycerol dehydratase family glycyl radical enzyme
LENIRYFDADDCKKADFLRSVIIALSAIIRLANRYGDLAAKMALEAKSQIRQEELALIADICHQVPGNPARTFYEALQSFWFIWMMIADGTAPGGRFDQFMFPYYDKDKKNKKITDDEVLELLECLRIKIMQYNFVGGGKQQRAKWAGLARWHNWVIGGVTEDGKDASNELSYLILEAAKDLQTPHHTITLRVHEGTPDTLMLKALEVVRTGTGMPAFVGDKSYIEYLVGQGVSLQDARNYALAGCLDVAIPAKSRINAFGMFNVPLVFEITLNNGIEPRTGKLLGLQTGEFTSFATFNDVFEAFKKQLTYFMGLTAEEHNILLQAQKELFPDPVHSSLMFDAIKVGKDMLDRTMPFENGSALNCVGMINIADSLAVIKKLIYDEKKITAMELFNALKSNWQGDRYSKIREMCLEAPKYGNGDTYVDTIASDLYNFWAKTALTFPTIYGGTNKPTGISITAHAPGGAITGATPDGRYTGEAFADGTMSPAQGKDFNGPTAVIRSAIKIDQTKLQATLLNMKFHPSALQTNEDLQKLSDLIKTYFEFGGKHIQFNVVNKEILRDAQTHPENHRDLIVRVAGYSAYFVNLTRTVQDEIIVRTEQHFHSLE